MSDSWRSSESLPWFSWRLTFLSTSALCSIALLGPIIGSAVMLACSLFAVCVLTSAGFAVLTIIVSQVSTLGGLPDTTMFALKWAVTSVVLVTIAARYSIEKRSFDLSVDFSERLLIIFAVWCGFCSLFATHKLTTFAEALRIGVYPFLVIVVRETLTTRRHVAFALVGYALAAIVGAAYSIVDHGGIFGRYSGFAGNANSYGLYLSFTVPVLAACFFALRPFLLRFFFFCSTIVASAALLLSWSRASMLAVFVQAVTAAILFKKTKFLAAGAVAAVAILGFAILTPSVRNLATAGLRLQGGTTHRTVIWDAALDGALKSPIVGYGFGLQVGEVVPHVMWGNWGEAFVFKSLDSVFMPHNLYLHIALSAGLPGLILFLVLVWTLCRRHIRAGKGAKTSGLRIANYTIVAMIIGALFNGFFEAAALVGKGAINNYFWVAVGIVAAYERIEHSDDNSDAAKVVSTRTE